MAGFCQIWISRFELIAKPPNEAIKGPDFEPLEWKQGLNWASQALKSTLPEAQALGLPDLEKLFIWHVAEKQWIALRVLTPNRHSIPRPASYLSKQLYSVATRWPGCLRAVAATALFKEVAKLTLG